MPRSIQLKPELKKEIKALLPRNGFPSQQALAEHLGLSRDVVSRFLNGKPIDRLNAEEICGVLGCDIREVTYIEETKPKEPKIDWGEATNNSSIFQLSTRTEQLKTLKQWIIEDKCRIIFIEGMKGMGKTRLSYQLADQIKNDFDYVILRSLDQYQSIDELLKDLLLFLNDEEDIKALDTKQKIDNLIKKLKSFRCLLILANIDWAIEKYSLSFRDQNYNFFLKELAEKQDKSCLVMTSNIEPREIGLLVAQNQWSRHLEIEPLSVESIKNIFNGVGLFEGAEEDWKKLRDIYQGNHFVLVNVAINIQKSFAGSITHFINYCNEDNSYNFVFNGIEEFIKEQLENLSETERNVMYWLALYRNPISLFELKEIMGGLWGDQLLIISKHLKSRFFLNSKDEGILILPPMIRDYLIKVLINNMTNEIIKNRFDLLNNFPLFLPTATIKVRKNQENFILKPIIEKLETEFNTKETIKKHLRTILHQHKNNSSDKYIGGNLFNLLVYLGSLEEKDFSYLVLNNANLREVYLKDTDFTGSKLSNSMFLNGFSNVISVGFSPDGKWLAIGDTNAQIYLWKVGDGCPVLEQIINTNNGWVRAITFSPDSKIIASGGEEGNINLWEVKTGKPVATFSEHLDRIRAVSYSPNGQLLASSSDDGTVRIWDCNRKELITVLTKHQDKVRWAIFHPDQHTLISASQDNQICLWDVNLSEAKLIKSFSLKENKDNLLRAIAISPDGKLLASGTDDGVVRFWNLEKGTFKQNLSHNHNHWIRSLAFSPDGDKIASASEDTNICVSDVKTGQHLHTLRGHNGGVWSIDFHPKLPWLLSGSMGFNVRIWNHESGECLRVAQGYGQEIKPITYSPDGKTLAVGTNQGIVYLKDSSELKTKTTIETHRGNILSLAYSPDGQVLIGGSDDTKLYIWDTYNNNKQLASSAEHKNWIRTVAYSPDGKFMATGGDDKMVKLWDSRTYKLLRTFPGHTDWIQSICFHPTQPLLISGSDDGTIKFWDIEDLKTCSPLVKIFKTPQRQVWTVAISPDGKLMASGSNDNTLCIWDLESENTKPIMIIKDHRNWISSVAFSPDNQWLASGSYDSSIRIWKISSTQYSCHKILLEHDDAVMCVTFHPHEPILASSSKDGTIKRWNYLTGDCLSSWRSPRPYENMNITGVTGLNSAQKYALKTLGAIEL
ncbi:NB-ARC domain-containing protein [Crocosphaera sp.]|uniref:WD40 domain-containing protein n=1 Tax=Crocosphaera sp. TaxID=2729996 RepID=UPI003F209144|nr:NB-ARC domain-containing protein [Crocosphaera sp.]